MFKVTRFSVSVVVLTVFVSLLTGCGGGGSTSQSSTPAAIAVTITQGATASVDNTQTKNLTAGVTWTLTGAGTLSSQTTTSVTYNAPASGSATSVTVTAASITDPTKTAAITIAVAPVPTVAATPAGWTCVNGSSYTYTVALSGGTSPFTYSITAGALPNGMTLDATGKIAGTPNANATQSPYNVTVKVQDSVGMSTTKDYAFTINNPPAPQVTAASPASGVVNTAYAPVSFSVASGGLAPFTWSESGALPPGMTLSAAGTLSGTPTQAGTYPIVVQVQDNSNPKQTGTLNVSLQIDNPAPPSITTASLPDGTVGTTYSQTIASSNGLAPYTWSVTAGTLPAGLNLSNSTSGSVTLSGTPTTAQSGVQFTVQVKDSANQTGTKVYTMNVANPPAPTITTASLPDGTIGTAYSQTVQASNGLAPFTWVVSSGTLPAGLTLGNSTTNSVTISGTPTTAQSNVQFTVQVTDSTSQTATQTYTVNIAALPIIVNINNPISTIQAGAAPVTFNATVQHSSQGVTWTLTSGGQDCTGTCGALSNPTGSSVTYTPPATVSNGVSAVITATSMEDGTKSNNFTFTVTALVPTCTAQGNESAFVGQFAFTLSGYNNSGFAALAGSITSNGTGGFTAGEIDGNGAVGLHHANIIAGSSSYSLGSDGRGCLIIASSFGTFQTRISVGSNDQQGHATKGRIIEWETGQTAYIAAGRLFKQSSAAFTNGANGNYAFFGIGRAGAGERFAYAGTLNVNWTSGGDITAVAMDANDSGAMTAASGGTGHLNSFNSNGRSTMNLSVGGNSSTTALYMVDASNLLLISTDDPQSNPVTSGEARAQTGTFSASSLNARSVFYMAGVSGTNASMADLGLFTPNGNGAFDVTVYESDGGTMNPTQSMSGTYTVASNGRTVLSGVGNHPPLLYLTSPNTAFMLGTDNAVVAGYADVQIGAPFSNASISGSFIQGDLNVTSQNMSTCTGNVVLNNGTVSGYTDCNSATWQSPGDPNTGSVTINPDGTFAPGNNGIGIVVSSQKVVLIDHGGSTWPTIQVVEK